MPKIPTARHWRSTAGTKQGNAVSGRDTSSIWNEKFAGEDAWSAAACDRGEVAEVKNTAVNWWQLFVQADGQTAADWRFAQLREVAGTSAAAPPH